MKKIQLLTFILGALFVFSCARDEAEEIIIPTIEVPEPIVGDTSISDTTDKPNPCDTVLYSKHVAPIFIKNCAIDGCHTDADAPRLNYTSHSVIKQNKNLILSAIKQEGSFEMPLDPNSWTPFKLPEADIRTIECWMENGAKND